MGEKLKALWKKLLVIIAQKYPTILRHALSSLVTFTSFFMAVLVGLLETNKLNNFDNLSWGALASILVTALRAAVKLLYERVVFPAITNYMTSIAEEYELKGVQLPTQNNDQKNV